MSKTLINAILKELSMLAFLSKIPAVVFIYLFGCYLHIIQEREMAVLKLDCVPMLTQGQIWT